MTILIRRNPLRGKPPRPLRTGDTAYDLFLATILILLMCGWSWCLAKGFYNLLELVTP